jgi:GTP-binding protein EngB required for normal cell division
LLPTLEEIVAAQGLVEFQGALESIVERLEAGTVEVAFFGRVSSGKSSLLNLILGGPVLPVGVTPVTAVPTRIEAAASAGAAIAFADGPAQEVAIERLPEFVLEQGNPGNEKHVVRAAVRVPAGALKPGLVLVDTPGVGALAAAGARAAYHYLPRCDIGVVLVDAAGSLSAEDVDLVRLLLESGIQPLVLVSKADLIRETERGVFCDYVHGALERALAASVPVLPVSTVGPDATLAIRWYQQELAPLADRARATALASAGRKLEAVRQGVVAALRTAAGALDGAAAAEAESRRADDAARDAEALIRETQGRLDRLAEEAKSMAPLAIARAAAELARRSGGPSLESGLVVREAAAATARDLRNQICDEMAGVRDRLAVMVSGLQPGPPAERLHAGGLSVDLVALPELVVPECVDAIQLRVPWWLRKFRGALERRLADDIQAQAGGPLQDAVRRFAGGLGAWSRQALERLANQIASQIEPLRMSGRVRADPTGAARAALTRLEGGGPRPARQERGGEGP